MKYDSRHLFKGLLLLVLVSVWGCSDLAGLDPMPNQPTSEEIVEDVGGTWRVIDMYTDTGRESDALSEFEVTFTVNAEKTGGEFVAQNGGDYFAPTGKWHYNGLVGRAQLQVPQMTFEQEVGEVKDMEFFHERNDAGNGVPEVLVLARNSPRLSINMYRVD